IRARGSPRGPRFRPWTTDSSAPSFRSCESLEDCAQFTPPAGQGEDGHDSFTYPLTPGVGQLDSAVDSARNVGKIGGDEPGVADGPGDPVDGRPDGDASTEHRLAQRVWEALVH